jgi:hypothetical protein
MHRTAKKLLGSVAALATTAVGTSWVQKTGHGAANDMLDLYGFDTQQKIETLDRLMRKAEILAPEQSLAQQLRKGTVGILDIVEKTQDKFAVCGIRNGGTKERWQTVAPDWTKDQETEIMEDAKKLGLLVEIPPTNNNPDAICIFGATLKRMQHRLDYTHSLLSKNNVLPPKFLVLMVGDRKASIDVDGSEQELMSITRDNKLEDISKLTEVELMRHAYQNSALRREYGSKFILYCTYTPSTVLENGERLRPTTETTVTDVTEWLKLHPDVKNVLFISNQPHIQYKKSAIDSVWRGVNCNTDIKYEVAGSYTPGLEAKDLLGALGTHIWARTPQVMSLSGLNIVGDDLRDRFTKLYSKQPVLFGMLSKLFTEREVSKCEGRHLLARW